MAKAVISDTNKTISNETKGMSSGESDVTSKTGTTDDVDNESSKDDGKDKSSWADLINIPGRPAGHKPSALERRVDALQSQLDAHHDQLQNDREKKLTAIPVDGSAGVGLQYSLNGGTTTTTTTTTTAAASSVAVPPVVDGNTTGVVSGQTGVVSGQTGVVSAQTGVVSGQSSVVSGQSGVVGGQSGVVKSQSGVVNSQSGVVSAPIVSVSETN